MLDVAIIGSGPAGVAAAINVRQRNRSLVLLGAAEVSRKLESAQEIANYPGFPEIGGAALGEAFHRHLDALGIAVERKYVDHVYPMGDFYALTSGEEMWEARSVVLATGVTAFKPIEGEIELLKERPDAVILRPSVMFGPHGGIYDRMAGTGLGWVMPITGAKSKMQPVYVDDVAQAAELAVLGDVAPGIYELGGPDVKAIREMADETLAATMRRRMVVNLPFWLSGLVAGALDIGSMLTGGLFTNRMLTRDQVKMLRGDNVVAEDAKGFADLGIEPVPPGAVINEYLWRFRPSGQYAEMTASAKNMRAR